MKYKGSKLKEWVQSHRGAYTDICIAMLGGRKKGLDNYYADDKNISIDKLSAVLRATGLSIDYFVEFEEGEFPSPGNTPTIGNHNVINSMVGRDLTEKVEHLNEVISLKNQIIIEKEKQLAMKDQEIMLWKKRYDDSLKLAKLDSDETRT
jgi:hypothetical protein